MRADRDRTTSNRPDWLLDGSPKEPSPEFGHDVESVPVNRKDRLAPQLHPCSEQGHHSCEAFQGIALRFTPARM